MTQKASVRPGATLRLKLTGIAPGGVGVAQAGGLRFFVRGGLPGDVVEVQVVKRERGRIEAVVVRRMHSEIKRIAPPCRHFSICGGCRWQDLDYRDQLALKKGIVQHCFREAGLDEGLVEDALGAEEAFFYRNKMDFSFGVNKAGALTLGLYVSKDRQEVEAQGHAPVFDVEECLLQSPLSNQIVRAVRDFLKGRDLRPYDPEARTGLLRSLVVREGKRTGEVLVNLVTAEGEPGLTPLGEALRGMFPEVKGVVLSANRRRSKNALPETEEALAGEGQIVERVGGLAFGVSPASFFQVNTRQAERLYDLAVQLCGLTGRERVLDLYCGTGTLSLLTARRAASVTGVEAVAQAVEDARRNTARNGVENCRFLCGDVLRVLPDLARAGEPFDAVTVNPPRAGVYRAAIQAICALRPGRVVYVSCNPETLARDVPRFWAGGYRLGRVQPVDLFPHTPHCEVVAQMTR
ncbi:MAG: 23S rRNA (uracil-5-)-methyltransferase RumA [Candidatus Handelsmanbacteria bacterium RIFCSPLOWO2_12_FULL_64_10]|uniref:23S rRNA (Uracil-5-)-methyltransferase RumA n=1 Tax=Handelsmanbacteria sp. (strain RIFCSPLOWO2_12_FULL_64_10) TaxID=1817868 RepID=A0A1F6CAZ1_HANXR|nr:MAG: 23S rRNA (uracil-5-)-methyltransferase RumA [Candidatus Handelsmanbacteria bacterium RIFCSPLOWO2_12_FULL_64_10]